MMAARKLVLSAVVAMLVTAVFGINAYATEARVDAMGGVGFYIKDNSNVFYFPGTFYDYPEQVFVEMRSKISKSKESFTAGIHLPLGDDALVAAYFNRPVSTSIPSGIVEFVCMDRATEVYYGKAMSNFNMGLGLTVALDNYKEPYSTGGKASDEYTESARYIAISAGMSKENMDLGVMFELPSATSEFPGDDEDKWSGIGLGFIGRYFTGEEDRLIVPAGGFKFGSSKNEYGDYEADYSEFGFFFGVAMDYEVNDENTLVLGIEPFRYFSETMEVKDGRKVTETDLMIPGLFLGIESEVTSWLTGRVGAKEVFHSNKTKTEPAEGDETETSTFKSDFFYNMGIAVGIGDFVFDAVINEALFFEGPNFISGGVADWASKVSVTYTY